MAITGHTMNKLTLTYRLFVSLPGECDAVSRARLKCQLVTDKLTDKLTLVSCAAPFRASLQLMLRGVLYTRLTFISDNVTHSRASLQAALNMDCIYICINGNFLLPSLRFITDSSF